MKHSLGASALLLILTTCIPILSAAAEPLPENNSATVRPARPPEDKEKLESRLASVTTLIERSSAAKQIEASASPQALAMRGQARELRQQAVAAFVVGNLVEASSLLDQAAKMFFNAVRLASPKQVTGEKQQGDFDARLDSVKALLAAQKRISAEKNQGSKGTATSTKIESQMGEASALAAAGKLDEGRALLDKVYTAIRTEIETLREGATLVRSLDFASKEEEYLYEIDRNDTHKMLIKALLDEKRTGNANLDTAVKIFLDQAAVLRAQAEGMAAKKDYEAGIKLLEDATKELVRAIRGVGVYIPG